MVSSHYDHGVPKIDPTGPVPPYLQVAEIIRGQIRSGKLPTGSRITEAEITETYEVARSTARRTLAVLRDEGLIFTVPQRGSYVANQASLDHLPHGDTTNVVLPPTATCLQDRPRLSDTVAHLRLRP